MAGLLKTGNGARANSSNGASRWDSAAESSGRFAKVHGTRRRRLKLLLLLSGGTACKALVGPLVSLFSGFIFFWFHFLLVSLFFVGGHQIVVCWDLKRDSAIHKCSLCHLFRLYANG